MVAGDLHRDAESMLAEVMSERRDDLIRTVGCRDSVRLRVPGAHNQRNAACVLAVCRLLGPAPSAVRDALAAFPGHRYILRGFSPVAGRGTTLGGGRILSILTPRRRRKDKQSWLSDLEVLQAGGAGERLVGAIAAALVSQRLGELGLDRVVQSVLSAAKAIQLRLQGG